MTMLSKFFVRLLAPNDASWPLKWCAIAHCIFLNKQENRNLNGSHELKDCGNNVAGFLFIGAKTADMNLEAIYFQLRAILLILDFGILN
jgi:hypothetical protein